MTREHRGPIRVHAPVFDEVNSPPHSPHGHASRQVANANGQSHLSSTTAAEEVTISQFLGRECRKGMNLAREFISAYPISAAISAVLSLMFIAGWTTLWLALSFEIKAFLATMTAAFVGVGGLVTVNVLGYLTEHGLVSILPESLQSDLFERPLLDVIHNNPLKTLFGQVVMVLMAQDDEELTIAVENLPPLLQSFFLHRGVLNLTPAYFRNLVVPKGKQWPAVTPASAAGSAERHRGQSHTLRRRISSTFSSSNDLQSLSVLEDFSEHKHDETDFESQDAYYATTRTLHRRRSSGSRAFRLPSASAAFGNPTLGAGDVLLENAFPRSYSQQSLSSLTVPTYGMPPSPAHSRLSIGTASPAAAESVLGTVNENSRASALEPALPPSIQTTSRLGASSSHATTPRSRQVVSSSQEPVRRHHHHRHGSSRRRGAKTGGGIYALLDRRLRTSIETAVNNYLSEPLARIPKSRLRAISAGSGFIAFAMFCRSRSVRTATTKGALLGTYVSLVLTCATAAALLHYRSEGGRRTVRKASKNASYAAAWFRNASAPFRSETATAGVTLALVGGVLYVTLRREPSPSLSKLLKL